MAKETKNYLFEVKTTEDINGIPEGSGIYVTKELKNDYKGLWSSMMGTFEIKIPKNKCIKLDSLE